MILQSSGAELGPYFAGLFDGPSASATAPMLALGVGVMLLLLCDIVDALKPARALVFLGAIAAALVGELALLSNAPGTTVLQGSLTADPTTALWGVLFLFATALAWFYSHGYYRAEDRPFKAEHDALMLSAPVGMMLMVGANDLLVFFVGLELLSIPLYTLAAFRRARMDSVEAGIKYFLLGAFAAGLFAYGASLLYMASGSLELAAIAEHAGDDELALAGAALIAAALFFKVSVFPFHLWVPDVYQGSPTPVTALMATGTKAAAIGFLVKAAGILPAGAAPVVALVAVLTIAAGNLGALVQQNVKRMLAYSGVAHAGVLLLVVAGAIAMRDTGDYAGDTRAALYYMAAYVFTAMGAFGILALLEADGEHFTRLENLRGLARRRPALASALSLFLLSLGGIPLTGGFLGKWFAFWVLVDAEMYVFAVLGAVLSVVALGYYLRVIVAMWMQPAPEGLAPPTTTRMATAGMATAVCALFVLLLGVFPDWLLAQLG